MGQWKFLDEYKWFRVLKGISVGMFSMGIPAMFICGFVDVPSKGEVFNGFVAMLVFSSVLGFCFFWFLLISEVTHIQDGKSDGSWLN